MGRVHAGLPAATDSEEAAAGYVAGPGKAVVVRRSSGVLQDVFERGKMRVLKALLCASVPILGMQRLRGGRCQEEVVPSVHVHRERLYETKMACDLLPCSQESMAESTAGIGANPVRWKGSAVVDAMRHDRLRPVVPERTPRQGFRDRHRALEGAAGDCKLREEGPGIGASVQCG